MPVFMSQMPFQGILIAALFLTLGLAIAYRLVRKSPPQPRMVALMGATAVYMIFMYSLFIRPKSLTASDFPLDSILQLTPFATISTAGQLSIWGTLLAFVPLPLLIFAYTRSMKKTVVWALAIAILVEPLQLVIDIVTGFPSFVVDVDDMMLQVLGSFAGIVLMALAARVVSGRKGLDLHQTGVSEGPR